MLHAWSPSQWQTSLLSTCTYSSQLQEPPDQLVPNQPSHYHIHTIHSTPLLAKKIIKLTIFQHKILSTPSEIIFKLGYILRSSTSLFQAWNLRLRSAVHWHHHPQIAVLSRIHCFGESEAVVPQILLNGAEPRDAGTSWLSSPVHWREANRIL